MRVIDGTVTGAITRGIVRVFASQVGRGPTKARTVISGDLVVVVLEDTLTPSEKTLLEDDAGETVASLRRRLQRAMMPEMAAVIEGSLGCTVRATLSDHDPENDVCVEVFLTDGNSTEPALHE